MHVLNVVMSASTVVITAEIVGSPVVAVLSSKTIDRY